MSYLTQFLDSARTTVVSLGSVTGAVNADLRQSEVFTLTLTGNTTLTFTNPPSSGYYKEALIIVTQGGSGSYSLTITNGKYTDGIVPVLTTTVGAVDVLSYFTVDSGTKWIGAFAMADVK